MIFEQVQVGRMENFAYIIGDGRSKEAAVVDPAWENDKIRDLAGKHGLEVRKILVTHTDFDHIEGVKKMVGSTGAVVYVHRKGVDDIKSLGIGKVEAVEEGSEIKIGSVGVRVLHTPGHNPSEVSYLVDNNKLVTGDTLFVEGCGRVDMPGGDIQKQWKSLQRIKGMDESIEVYPGHNYGSVPHSTIKHEKENNPFLKCRDFEEFSSIR